MMHYFIYSRDALPDDNFYDNFVVMILELQRFCILDCISFIYSSKIGVSVCYFKTLKVLHKYNHT